MKGDKSGSAKTRLMSFLLFMTEKKHFVFVCLVVAALLFLAASLRCHCNGALAASVT